MRVQDQKLNIVSKLERKKKKKREGRGRTILALDPARMNKARTELK